MSHQIVIHLIDGRLEPYHTTHRIRRPFGLQAQTGSGLPRFLRLDAKCNCQLCRYMHRRKEKEERKKFARQTMICKKNEETLKKKKQPAVRSHKLVYHDSPPISITSTAFATHILTIPVTIASLLIHIPIPKRTRRIRRSRHCKLLQKLDHIRMTRCPCPR